MTTSLILKPKLIVILETRYVAVYMSSRITFQYEQVLDFA